MSAVVPGAAGEADRAQGVMRPSARAAALSKWCDTDGSPLIYSRMRWDARAPWRAHPGPSHQELPAGYRPVDGWGGHLWWTASRGGVTSLPLASCPPCLDLLSTFSSWFR